MQVTFKNKGENMRLKPSGQRKFGNVFAEQIIKINKYINTFLTYSSRLQQVTKNNE